MKNARVFMLLLAVVIFLPLTANAWVFGIPFTLSDDQVSKIKARVDMSSSDEVLYNIRRRGVMVNVYNGNDNISLTSVTLKIRGNEYTTKVSIPSKSSQRVEVVVIDTEVGEGTNVTVLSAKGKR